MGFLSRRRSLQKLGAFDILEKIDEGGMATVYRAIQPSLGRQVAIKVLKEKLGDDASSRERFERESTIIARLSHPNIVHVIDRGLTPEGCPYFAMEYLDGTSLDRVLAEERMEPRRKLEIAIQVSQALAYAHKNGIVHRDVKPANIIIDAEGNAIVLDFGIAKLTDAAADAPAAATRTDLVLGTMAYMAPEQLSGKAEVSAASDLYSLGIVLYEMFTGERPMGRFRPPSEIDPSLPPGLDEVILRCLEPDPGDRFASAGQLRDRLLEISQGSHLDTEERERAGGVLGRIREKFALLDVIRDESGGSVYLYQDRVEGKLFVIRKRVGSASGFAEAKMLAALPHRRILRVIGASGDHRRFIVVSEYMQGGSLKDRLVHAMPVEDALRVGMEAAEGLAFAHRNRILHGSLRPANLLFTDSGTVKVGDFGFDEHTPPGADPYNPFDEPRSIAADILALGIILYQAMTGLSPAWRGEAFLQPPQFLRLPDEVRNLLGGMLPVHPRKRIGSCDLVLGRLVRMSAELFSTGPDSDATVVGRREGPGGVCDQTDAGLDEEETEDTAAGSFLGRLLGRKKRAA